MRAAAGIVDPHDRAADLEGVFHQAGNFLGMHGPEGPAAHGKILAEGGHHATVHRPHAGDHAVAGQLLVFHAEVVAIVPGMHSPFHEGALVEQRVQPVPRGHDALFAAGFQFVFSTTRFGPGPALRQLREQFRINCHK